MLRSFSRKTVVAIRTDLRDQTALEFLETLCCYNPRLPLRLQRHGTRAWYHQLSGDLKLPAEEVEALCQMTARHYSLQWNEIDTAWLARRDRTVGALHHRLWLMANVKSGEPREYRH
jgi:hypothetical protein